jgi:acyl-CoA thioesterase FadM
MRLQTPVDRDLQAMDLLSWQGKCRELFLEDQTASIMHMVTQRELILQTTSASLDWSRRVPERDQAVRVEMRLESLKCGQMGVSFHYAIDQPGESQGVPFAIGHQSMSSKHMAGSNLLPCPLPSELLHALREYTHLPRLISKIEDILRFAEPTRLP